MEPTTLIGMALAIATFFIFRAILGGGGTRVSAEQARRLQKEGGVIIDVRTPGEFSSGKIKGSKNIPLQELSNRLKDIPKNKPIILCCRSGSRSGMAARLLKKSGYENVYNLGSWQSY